MRIQGWLAVRSVWLAGIVVSGVVDARAEPLAAPAEPASLIQELCLDTGATWVNAQPKLKAREQAPETIREEKFGNASVHHLKLSESARAELTVNHADNAVMSCTLHITVADVKAAFADMRRHYKMTGTLADYTLGKPPKDVPFVARSPGGKATRKMLGLFEFMPVEGKPEGSIQAIILRNEPEVRARPEPRPKG